MAIFHLSIRPISRAKGHSAVAQVAYDTRGKLTNERTVEKHDWSKHKADVIEWQIIGPAMLPGELAARAERAEKRWDARVDRAMDVALPHELNTKAQWELLRGFGLQLRDTYGAALCVSLHHPNTKGDHRNVHGHIFMTTRAVDDEGNFSKAKIRALDDRKLGPAEVERIRETWELRCNRALRKAGMSEDVNHGSLKSQGIDRPATKHLGAKASAMSRNGCRMRKAEINQLISSDSRRLAEIKTQLNQLKHHANRSSRTQSAQRQIHAGTKSNLEGADRPRRSLPERQTHGVAVRGKPRSAVTEIELLEIAPGRGLHIRTRHDSWLISLPEELQSDELLRAITTGEVNCLLGSCEPLDLSSDPSKPGSDSSNSVLEYE